VDEQQILFPEVYYKDYVVKPWSLSTHARTAPLVLLLIESLEEKKISLEDFYTKKIRSINQLMTILNYSLYIAVPLISATLKISEDEVNSLYLEDICSIASLVLLQNKRVILDLASKPIKSRKKDTLTLTRVINILVSYGHREEDIRHNYSIEQVWHYFNDVFEYDLEQKKFEAISRTNSHSYAIPAETKQQASKKQRDWQKFMDSLSIQKRKEKADPVAQLKKAGVPIFPS
jgi:hypothetical protein